MKVLLISKSFKIGGSAVGSKNLSRALKSIGVKCIEVDGFDYLRKNFLLNSLRNLERALDKIFFYGKECHFFRLGPYTLNLKNLINLYNPDVVQFCDISHNTINPIIPQTLNIPVFHRLSDFWPYDGIFHYPTKKNLLNTYVDNIFKKNIHKKSKNLPILICTSHWTIENLSLNVEKHFIRNSVALHNPKSRTFSNNRIIKLGFISSNLYLKRKGLNELINILKVFKMKQKIELILYGTNKKNIFFKNKNITINTQGGFKSNKKKDIFNSFDVLLCPSTFDNSPNVVTEAISFGIPVIGQINSGMESYINNKIGRLINFHSDNKYKAGIDLSNALKKILNDYTEYSENCIKFSRANLSYSKIGNDYKNLYIKKLNSN